jgi:tRNA-Thr(GGU) m(6)t(6)A37 methyltransferase TsaA
MAEPTFTLRPVAWIRSGYTDRSQVPKGPAAVHTMEGDIEVREDLAEGLQDIEGFSHLYVLWVFDRSDPGYDLLTTPPHDDRPHGLFATRTPRRPNPLALTVVELLGRDGRRLHVRGLDMLDGTPVVDIKPYLSNVPEDRLKRGWLAEAEARKARSASTGF